MSKFNLPALRRLSAGAMLCCALGAVPTAGTTKEDLANMMVGRPIENNLPRTPYNPGAPVLHIERLTHGHDGKPLDYEHLYCRADNFQYRLQLQRR